MDYLLTLFFLIIACSIGICISLLLKLKSYLISAFICTIIFICIELFYYYKLNNINKTKITSTYKISTNDIKSLLQKYITKSPQLSNSSDNDTQVTVSQNTQSPLTTNIYDTDHISVNNINNPNKPPLDGLEPTELMSRLNYIYHATAHPAQVISYNNYKTHADKYSLSNDNLYTHKYYPQLTSNQINAHDCLNEGSTKNSCFQSAQLFHNIKNNFNILNSGVNLDNANLIIREDFSIPRYINDPTE